MNDDRLTDLLRAADRDAGPPALRPDLADRVRRKALQRRRYEARGAAAAAMLVFAVGSGWLMSHSRPSSIAPQEVVDHDKLSRELAALRAEAEARTALVRRLQSIRRIGVARRGRLGFSIEPALARRMKRQVDRAAFTIVYTADRLHREAGLLESAVEQYRQAVRLFPDAPSSETARRRLVEIKSMNGESS